MYCRGFCTSAALLPVWCAVTCNFETINIAFRLRWCKLLTWNICTQFRFMFSCLCSNVLSSHKTCWLWSRNLLHLNCVRKFWQSACKIAFKICIPLGVLNILSNGAVNTTKYSTRQNKYSHINICWCWKNSIYFVLLIIIVVLTASFESVCKMFEYLPVQCLRWLKLYLLYDCM
jgi:hypothetical protein